METPLYTHQKTFLELNPRKHLLCWDTGTFKTRTAIEWMKINPMHGLNLVIVPKALKENWYREQKKWHGPDMFVLTKEEFRRDWQKLPHYNKVIVDEAHYFSGMKSLMSKNLRKYLRKHQVQFLLLLTATPYLSTPWNIYALAGHLGKDWSYSRFKDKFFTDRYIGRRVVPEVKEGIEDEIAALVATLGSIVRIDECSDIPEQVFEVEEFAMTDEQTKKKQALMEINPIVRFTKEHQIENGTLKGDKGYTEDEFVPSFKTDRLKDLCEIHDKIIIVCRYNLQIDHLTRELEGIGKPILVIRGEVKNRDEVVQMAEKASKVILLINAACSEGYELPSFPVMVFASMSFSYKDYKQMLGRILRLNKLKKNVYLHLVCEGIDEAVHQSIMRKKDFDIEIYAQEHGLSGEGLSDGLGKMVEEPF